MRGWWLTQWLVLPVAWSGCLSPRRLVCVYKYWTTWASHWITINLIREWKESPIITFSSSAIKWDHLNLETNFITRPELPFEFPAWMRMKMPKRQSEGVGGGENAKCEMFKIINQHVFVQQSINNSEEEELTSAQRLLRGQELGVDMCIDLIMIHICES